MAKKFFGRTPIAKPYIHWSEDEESSSKEDKSSSEDENLLFKKTDYDELNRNNENFRPYIFIDAIYEGRTHEEMISDVENFIKYGILEESFSSE